MLELTEINLLLQHLVDVVINSGVLWSDELYKLYSIRLHLEGIWRDDSLIYRDDGVFIRKTCLRKKPKISEYITYTSFLSSIITILNSRGFVFEDDDKDKYSELIISINTLDSLHRLGGTL